MVGDLIFLRDREKKTQNVHTIKSASIFPDENESCEISIESLELVVGGMSPVKFSQWREKVLNFRDNK